MIVCSCKAVSHREIEALIQAGADSVEAVGHACGAGTDCGGCRGQIACMIEEAGESTGACPSGPAPRRLPLAAA